MLFTTVSVVTGEPKSKSLFHFPFSYPNITLKHYISQGIFSIIYKTFNNPITKSKGYEDSMDFDQMFFSTIIDMPNNWDKISDFIDEK